MQPKNESILQEAQRLVYGDRAQSHGDFRENFEVAARIFSAWTGLPATAAHMLQALISLKQARFKGNPATRDHLTDLVGYTELLSRTVGV